MHLSLKRAGSTVLGHSLRIASAHDLMKYLHALGIPPCRYFIRSCTGAVFQLYSANVALSALFPRGPDQPSPLLDPSAEALGSSRGWAVKPNGVIRAKGGRLKTPREAGGRAFSPLPNCPGKPVLRRDRNPLAGGGVGSQLSHAAS